MAYRSKAEEACQEIDDARGAVAKAQAAHSRGGSVDAVNRANDRLATAHSRYREVSGGNVPDDR